MALESPIPVVRFRLLGTEYKIAFTQNALYRFEEKIGVSLATWFSGAIADGGMRFGMRETQLLLWAGLEGARLRMPASERVRTTTKTIDEVGELLDASLATGGVVEVLPEGNDKKLIAVIASAFVDAMQIRFSVPDAGNDNEEEGGGDASENPTIGPND